MEVPRGFTRCDECEGKGSYSYSYPVEAANSPREYDDVICPSCSGSGLVSHETCIIHQAQRAIKEDPRICWEYDGKDDCQFTPEVAEHLGGSRYGLHRMVCSYCGCAFAVCFNAKLKCCPDCNHFLDVEAAK